LLKSSTLRDRPAQEGALTLAFHSELEAGARRSLGLVGGFSFVSEAAGISILFVDAYLASPSDLPVLPFTLEVHGYRILFDILDSSPVFVSGTSEANSCVPYQIPHCVHADPGAATTPDAAQDSLAVVDEADAASAFQVQLPTAVLAGILDQCTQCFGYGLSGDRCTNQRRPASGRRGAPVWCHHHSAQARAFQKFMFDGERPHPCEWWERYEYEELVMGGRKIST
jgi:hypothetical protein